VNLLLGKLKDLFHLIFCRNTLLSADRSDGVDLAFTDHFNPGGCVLKKGAGTQFIAVDQRELQQASMFADIVQERSMESRYKFF